MNAISPPEHPFPERMDELAEGEHLVAWSLRRWLAGHADNDARHWLRVWNRLAGALGADDGRVALGGLETLVRVICNDARRPVRYHRPCCTMLGPDEFRVVALVAACQQGRWAVARGHAEWLVGGDGVGDLLHAASRLAGALARRGRVLPPRDAQRAEEPALYSPGPAAGRVLH